MKFRSLLLVGCMLVVPGLALCTHLIPPEVRRALRRPFTPRPGVQPGVQPAVVARDASPPPTAAAAPAPPPEAGNPASTIGRSAPVSARPLSVASATSAPVVPAAVTVPPTPPTPAAPATAGPLDRPPVAATAPTPAAAPPTALVSQMADRARQVRDQQVREQQSVAAQLEALGALAFECQPIPGAPGQHGSSCRMPIDAGGQLQRVFHATGHDPISASAALLEQVTAWQRRTAGLPPAAAAPGDERREPTATGSAIGTRFR